MAAAASLLLAASFEVPHLLTARYGVPPAPPRSYFRPGVPLEAFRYTKQTVVPLEQPEASDELVRSAGNAEAPPSMIRLEKMALASLDQPTGAPRLAPTDSTDHSALAPSRSPNK